MAEKSNDFILNAALGFLGLLFLILLFALITRVLYPRVETTRTSASNILIGNIIQVEVLNGCGVGGVATQFTTQLRKNGFDVVESGNFDTFDVKNTLVIDRSGNLEHARRVATALGVDEAFILREISKDFYLDATIVIGADYKSLKMK